MGLVFNPFTGNFDFTGSGGSGSGDVTHTGTLTAHEVILGNGGADIKALGAVGLLGEVLTSGGAGVDPSWQPAGSGTIGGTIAATQVAFGTAPDTIGGEASLIWTTATGTLSVLKGKATGGGLLLKDASSPDVRLYAADSDNSFEIDIGATEVFFVQTDYGESLIDEWHFHQVFAETTDPTVGDAVLAGTAVITGSRAFSEGIVGQTVITGGTITNDAIGVYGGVIVNAASTVAQTLPLTAVTNYVAGATTTGYGVYTAALKTAGTVNNYLGYWHQDLAGIATSNGYYEWFDSQGVYRIREDNVIDTASFPQAVTALYNPRFTKYTAGAANFERIVQQWESNVATIRTEAGGTGTLRALNLGGSSVTVNGVVIATVTDVANANTVAWLGL